MNILFVLLQKQLILHFAYLLNHILKALQYFFVFLQNKKKDKKSSNEGCRGINEKDTTCRMGTTRICPTHMAACRNGLGAYARRSECFVNIAREIIKRENLLIVCADTDEVEKHFSEEELSNITFVEMPTNDTWARDHGYVLRLWKMGNPLFMILLSTAGE